MRAGLFWGVHPHPDCPSHAAFTASLVLSVAVMSPSCTQTPMLPVPDPSLLPQFLLVLHPSLTSAQPSVLPRLTSSIPWVPPLASPPAPLHWASRGALLLPEGAVKQGCSPVNPNFCCHPWVLVGQAALGTPELSSPHLEFSPSILAVTSDTCAKSQNEGCGHSFMMDTC